MLKNCVAKDREGKSPADFNQVKLIKFQMVCSNDEKESFDGRTSMGAVIVLGMVQRLGHPLMEGYYERNLIILTASSTHSEISRD